VSQSLIVTLQTYICKLCLENYFLNLDTNGNVLLDIGLKELVRHMIVSTELRWVVFGCCGVVLYTRSEVWVYQNCNKLSYIFIHRA